MLDHIQRLLGSFIEERDGTDLHTPPLVLRERLEVTVDDEVGSEALDRHRMPWLLAPFEGTFGDPLVQAPQGGGGRQGHGVGVRERRRLAGQGVLRVERSRAVDVDELEVVAPESGGEPGGGGGWSGPARSGPAAQPLCGRLTAPGRRGAWSRWRRTSVRLRAR